MLLLGPLETLLFGTNSGLAFALFHNSFHERESLKKEG